MKIRRTANAGVLLELDDIKILLDGVCQASGCYLATPLVIRKMLEADPPHMVLFTHTHEDHCCMAYAESCGKALFPGSGTGAVRLGDVQITAIPTRHMGRAGKIQAHQSFVIEGSRCIWFLGDAAPAELKKLISYPRPDVLMVPYPYISTPHALQLVQALLPCSILLLHLPEPGNDPEGIWQIIAAGAQKMKSHLHILEMGQTIEL